MVMEIVISVILLFIGIAVLVTIHVCVVGRAFRRNYENGNVVVHMHLNLHGTNSSMSMEEIKKLPCFEVEGKEEGGGGGGAVDCAVCLENFKAGEKCRLLPRCNHSFHAQCIDSWLLNTAACPICRMPTNWQDIAGESSNSTQV